MRLFDFGGGKHVIGVYLSNNLSIFDELPKPDGQVLAIESDEGKIAYVDFDRLKFVDKKDGVKWPMTEQ